jgi:hypothetical protein
MSYLAMRLDPTVGRFRYRPLERRYMMRAGTRELARVLSRTTVYCGFESAMRALAKASGLPREELAPLQTASGWVVFASADDLADDVQLGLCGRTALAAIDLVAA